MDIIVADQLGLCRAAGKRLEEVLRWLAVAQALQGIAEARVARKANKVEDVAAGVTAEAVEAAGLG